MEYSSSGQTVPGTWGNEKHQGIYTPHAIRTWISILRAFTVISFYILKKGLNFNTFDSDLPFWLHSKGLPNHRPAIIGAKKY